MNDRVTQARPSRIPQEVYDFLRPHAVREGYGATNAGVLTAAVMLWKRQVEAEAAAREDVVS